jgi:hypothetical protein
MAVNIYVAVTDGIGVIFGGLVDVDVDIHMVICVISISIIVIPLAII